MYVVNRDGRLESVHFDKIIARLKKLSYSLSQDHCNLVLVAQKVCAGVYKGVTTSQLDDFYMVSNFFSQPLEVTAHVINDGSHWDSEIEEIAGRLCFLKEKRSWKSSLPPANMSPSGNELARIKDMYNHFNERSGQKAPSIADDVYEIIMKVI